MIDNRSPRILYLCLKRVHLSVAFLALAFLAAGLLVPARSHAASTLLCNSSTLQVAFRLGQPGLSALSVDSLGRGEFRPSPLVDSGTGPDAAQSSYVTSTQGGWFRYAAASDPSRATWEMQCDGNKLRMRSTYQSGQADQAGASRNVTLRFNPDIA